MGWFFPAAACVQETAILAGSTVSLGIPGPFYGHQSGYLAGIEHGLCENRERVAIRNRLGFGKTVGSQSAANGGKVPRGSFRGYRGRCCEDGFEKFKWGSVWSIPAGRKILA